jgi:uracil-DNA glycosylase family protein
MTDALEALAAEAARCTACDLYRRATQTVFGEGPSSASVLMIGEQPGDQEDLAGKPFVGPAGRILDQALADAGIAREDVYVTNAVKHFKWKPRGKRRLHDKPNRKEIIACKQWLDAELEIVDPEVIVVLGATAGQALFGSKFRVGAARGQVLDLGGYPVVVTNHPSAVLRAEPGVDRDTLYEGLVRDLQRAADVATSSSGV